MKAEEYEFETRWYGEGLPTLTPPEGLGWELVWWRPVVTMNDEPYDVALWKRKKETG